MSSFRAASFRAALSIGQGAGLVFIVCLPAHAVLAETPVPAVEVLPEPYDQASFRSTGRELTRYHFGPSLRRPFLYPLIGPSGRSLTRMGHPRDPHSHRHHNSVWISHHDVEGVDFWSDDGDGRIVHERVDRFEDGADAASMTVHNAWRNDADDTVLLDERRTLTLHVLPGDEWLLVVDLELAPRGESVTLGKTPFGLLGVRMAKTIGVHDGGGVIRNSEGGENEQGVFWKAARWVDYSGPVTGERREGVTLLDHPGNPNHPSVFHVRDDGWMGASLTFSAPRVIERSALLVLRYGLYVHAGEPPVEDIERRWTVFRDLPRPAPSDEK